VKVDLIIRDSCRLRPGIPGLSENVRVVSVVGRFLEHSRVFYFRIGGREEYYIGSADAMRRNLSSRIEILTPVEDSNLQDRLRYLLDSQLGDERSAWEMLPDGSYRQRRPSKEGQQEGAQEALIRWTEKRDKQVTKAQKKKPRVLGQRSSPQRT
jgi:polyphosphate kinase